MSLLEKTDEIDFFYFQFPSSVSFNDNNILKQFLYNKGPLAVSINVLDIVDSNETTMQLLNMPFKTILKTKNVSDCQPDHQVLLVGYDTFQGKPYWIIKNSWGHSWGNDGFFAVYMSKKPSSLFFECCCINNLNTIHINYNEFDKNRNNLNLFNTPFDNRKIPITIQAGAPQYKLGYNTPKTRHVNLIQAPSLNLDKIPSQFMNSMSFTGYNNKYGTTICGPAYNQAQCGSCWLFGCNDMLSCAISAKCLLEKKQNKYVFLSPQVILNIDSESTNVSMDTICQTGGNAMEFATIIKGSFMGQTSNLGEIKLQSINQVPYKYCPKNKEMCKPVVDSPKKSDEKPLIFGDGSKKDDNSDDDSDDKDEKEWWEKNQWWIYIIVAIVVLILLFLILSFL